MSVIAGILAGFAAKAGAALVGKVLGDRFGPAGAEIAETVVTKVAGRLGVPAAEIPDQPEADIKAAVVEVEREMPDVLLAHVEQQKATHALLTSRKTPRWVAAWQWFIMFLWAFNGPVVAIANSAFGARIDGIAWSDLVWLTVTYQGLNMGGHTALRLFDKWKSARRP